MEAPFDEAVDGGDDGGEAPYDEADGGGEGAPSAEAPASRKRGRPPGQTAGLAAAATGFKCRVPGCAQPDDTSTLRRVHQRARACAEHLKALQLEDDSGALVRFCQRCSKWEPLTAFEGVKRTCTAQLLVHNERRRAEYARSKASAVRSGAQQTQQLPQADQGAMPGLAQPTAAMIQQYVAAAVAAATSAQAAAQVQVAPAAAQHHATAQQLTQVAPPGQPQAAALAAAAAALQNGGAGGAEVGPNGFQAALAGMLVGLLSNGAQQPQQATQQPAPTVTPEIWQQLMAQQRPQ